MALPVATPAPAQICPKRICEVGSEGGLLLPLGLKLFGDDSEQRLDFGFRAFLYMLALSWTFMGVAIVSDVFMGAIERITSKKKQVNCKNTGRDITVKVWNDTVANLTLMALGSSAPEILLSVIELCSGDMYSGPLGPSTIVGSAAFNLFCISAVCVVAIPGGETRMIKDTHVFVITASFSVFAYLWLYFIVLVSSENIITVWEAVVTFLQFPVLVALSFHADRGGFSSQKIRDGLIHHPTSRTSMSVVSKSELAQIEVKIRQKHTEDSTPVSDEALVKMIQQEHAGPKSRAQYRVQATRDMVGGKRINKHVGGGDSAAIFAGSSISSVTPFDPTAPSLKMDDIVIEFPSATYSVIESVGTLTLQVKRYCSTECGMAACMVDFKTRDGSAKAGEDYTPIEGTLEFAGGEDSKSISVTIIDDTAYEDDEEFFVDLSNARCHDANYSACVGRNKTAQISIVDDDEPGILRFQEDTVRVVEGLEKKIIAVNVRRMNGSTGTISCKYHTECGTALKDRDYISSSGTVSFVNGQTSSVVDLTILPRGRYDTREEFKLILTEARDTKFDATTEGGAESCILTIFIEADEKDKGRVDRLMQALQLDLDKAQIGHTTWTDQFRSAFYVNGGGDGDDGGDGNNEDGSASMMDWLMHILTVFWKVLFSIIPPADYCDGWPCFVVSLSMIGAVTAVIGDLASLLGCVLDLKGSITAITFVALGTSLPDTFASKTAAEQDPYADASIGNITGSNSVNVFLGLGMPWTIGAIYWMMVDKDSETARTWADKYPQVALEQKGTLQFVVIGGDLGFSVMVFSVMAVVCILVLFWRRRMFGGELGGPKGPKYATAVFFVLLWFIYIAMSSWKAMDSGGCK